MGPEQDEAELVDLDEGNTPAAPDADEQDDDAPLTRRELVAFEQRLLSQVDREVQSRTDKANRRLTKDLREKMAHYTRAADMAVAGGLIKEEDKSKYVRQMRDAAMDEAFISPNQAPANGDEPADDDTAATPPPTDEIAIAEINRQGEALAARLGLRGDDPETEFVQTTGTPAEFYASIRIAAQLKAKRMADPNAAAAPPARPAGRSPAAGAGGGRPTGTRNPIGDVVSSEALYDMAWKETVKKGR